MTDSVKNTTETPVGILFLDALDAQERTGKASNMILEQESAGQQQLVNSELLPTKINGLYDFDAKEALTKVGFKFGDEVDGDTMFQHVELPEGWKKEGSSHAMWSYVQDNEGRERISIFYKSAFYDRNAFFNVTPAVQTTVDRDEDESTGNIKLMAHVKVAGKTVFSTKQVDVIGDPDSAYSKQDALSTEARAWADENYPDRKDPTKYWN